MTKRPVAFCVDKHPSGMRELVAALTPEGFNLVLVETDSEEARVEKAREADYILCSWTPVSGQLITAVPKLKLI